MDVYAIVRKLETICSEAVFHIINQNPQLRHINIPKFTNNLIAFSLIHIYPWKYDIPPLIKEYQSNADKFIDTWCTHIETPSRSKYLLIELIKKDIKDAFVAYLMML